MSKKNLVKSKPKELIPFPPIIQSVLAYLPALVPFLTGNPLWVLPFAAAASLYSGYMVLCQEEVNEIIEFLKAHPNEFREEIVNSKEFRKGFIFFTQQYLKERAEEKRKIAKSIFLGYTFSQNKHDFELERLNDCLARITIPTLKFLIFLKSTILPSLNREIEEELKQDMYQKSDRSLEWWHSQMLTQKSVWQPISIWLEDNFNPARPKVKEEYGIMNNEGWPDELGHKADTRKREKQGEINDCMSELVTLGTIDIKVGGATWGGGGGKDYSLTTFGLKFLKLLD